MIEPFKASKNRTYHIRFKDGYTNTYYDVHEAEYLRGNPNMDELTVLLHSVAGTHSFKLNEVQTIDTEEVQE